MRIYGVNDLIDYEYLKFILRDAPISLKRKQPHQTDTFVRTVKDRALKAINGENRKSYLRRITSRR